MILNVPTTKGIQQEIVYSVYDFPYTLLAMNETCKTKKCTYYNISAAFDIESTTIEPPKGADGKYLYEPYGFMYHWQICIKSDVVFGRTWEEFQYFIKQLRFHMDLNEKRKLVIYVHNLAYEFQFTKEFLQIDSLFAKDKRKPLKVESQGIEFRCSYFLSNMSLQKFCENSELCTHYKLDGEEFDYKKLRTPNTPLTETELAYCYNDVRGLCECIDTMLQNDTIATIPLTNTGFVRRDYRNAMKSKENRYNFTKTQLNPEEYQMLKSAFRGGNTHASMYKANKILHDVESYDIQSSYPACIMLDEYPMGKFTMVTLDKQEKLDYFCSNYCVVLDVSFFNISLNYDKVIPYIDIAHCKERSNIKNDNGRVLSADFITITITNIDLDIIRSMYHYEGFTVNKAMYATKGKLPNELRNKMMEYYVAKTKLKGIPEKEYEYMKAKNRLNSTFGMMVTDIAHSEILYHGMEWEETKPILTDSIDDFYKSRNNFLSYQWGVFVTANARKRLQVMLDRVGLDVIYIDTDSIKFQNIKHKKEFEQLNKLLEKQAEENDIPAFVDHDGVRYHLGTWDCETKKANYKRFKTLGAKKYCYEQYNSKTDRLEFHITVSGMAKEKGAERVGTIENFKVGKTFTDIGRTTSWYNDSEIKQITVNGDTFTTASNIGILETTYTLGVTDEYWELLSEKGDIIL